jgi:hypothetical protein
MARYRIRYVSYAAEQLSQLPRSLSTAFGARIEDLKRGPYLAGDYDKRTGSYSTTFGEAGIILYIVSDEIVTGTIIRVNWVKW